MRSSRATSQHQRGPTSDSLPIRGRNHVDPTSAEYVDCLPFYPGEVSLRDVLYRNHIVPVTEWLIGHTRSPVLAIEANSSWETALTLRILLDVEMIATEQGDHGLASQANKLVAPIVDWLIGQSHMHSDGTACWDHVTWDTAAVVSALADALGRHPDLLHHTAHDSINQLIGCALSWLCARFDHWPDHVKYPFGDADVAQIAIALVKVATALPDTYRAFLKTRQLDASGDPAGEVARYLLLEKSQGTVDETRHTRTVTQNAIADTKRITPAQIQDWWGDPFNTAEVLEALARYHAFCRSNPSPDSHSGPDLQDIEIAIARACAYLEESQDDGMWGTHVDTIRTLNTYVLLPRLLAPDPQGHCPAEAFIPEVHLSFKALRWLCDEKQIMDDGSCLHTSFLTVFYAQTLAEVYRSWAPARRPILSIYDDVVWASPVRATPERLDRMQAEIHNAELRRIVASKDDELAAERRSLERSQLISIKTVATIALITIAILSVFVLSETTGALSLVFNFGKGKYTVEVHNGANFLQALSIVVAVTALAIGGLWKFDAIARYFKRGAR